MHCFYCFVSHVRVLSTINESPVTSIVLHHLSETISIIRYHDKLKKKRKKDWKCTLKSFWSFPYCAESCGYIGRVAFTMLLWTNSASSTAVSLGEKQHSAVTTLSAIQGVTAISGRKGNLHLKTFLFVCLFSRHLSAFYAHLKLSVLAVCHAPGHTTVRASSCAVNEMSPVERCLRHFFFCVPLTF